MKIHKKIVLSIALTVSVFIYGCGLSNAVKGGLIGGASGGAVGGVIGHYAGNTAVGAIIGAAVGGTAGVLIGKNMDKQAAELQAEIPSANVERVGEGIKITFDSGILFATNSSTLQQDAKTDIGKFAGILTKYPDSNILINGYTDNTGSAEYNQKLSERRANAVSDYATSHGVSASRLTVVGFGENQPVASNDTPEGKRQNRRVEIAVVANEKLKSAAENGQVR